MRRQRGRFRTITADNGTEFHGYAALEARTGVRFYFATPHHSWERGTNENTNGLIRQYLPKGQSMTDLTQSECDALAHHLIKNPAKDMATKHPMNASFVANQCCTSKLNSGPPMDSGMTTSPSSHFQSRVRGRGRMIARIRPVSQVRELRK